MEELLFLVTPYIAKKNSVMREAISPRMKLNATLRYLATGNSFQDLMFSTRIASNSLSQIIPETLQAIITVLEEKVISFPSKPEDWEIVADKFQTMWQFPHCIGALDGISNISFFVLHAVTDLNIVTIKGKIVSFFWP